MIVEGLFYAKAAAFFGAAIAIAIGILGPALGQGLIGMKGVENIGKYPESSSQIRTTMMIAISLVETGAIFVFLIAGALLWVGKGL